jgi:hypothetical protein
MIKELQDILREMEKAKNDVNEIIKRITDIIKNFGCFSVGELEYETNGVVVGQLGKFVGVAEFFNKDHADINVYEPSSFSSDEVDSYEMKYEEMSLEILKEVVFICEQWEAEQLQTEKRISN